MAALLSTTDAAVGVFPFAADALATGQDATVIGGFRHSDRNGAIQPHLDQISTRRSTIRRATDCNSSEWGMLPK